MKKLIFRDKRLTTALLWRALIWHFTFFLKRNPLPLAGGLLVTTRCNFKCSFCNYWRKPENKTLPQEKAFRLVKDLSGMGCFYFSVTGGEPLLVDYLFELLEYARGSRLRYIHLVTNGYLLDKARALGLKKAGLNEVSISIDGRPEYHDAKRMCQGAYKKAVEAVNNLKTYSPKTGVVLNTILDPGSPEECLHVLELTRNLNVYVKIQPLNQHHVFDKDNHAVFAKPNIDAKKLKETLQKLSKAERVINSKVFLDNIYNFFCRKERLIFKERDCLFGFHNIEFMEDGSVFPCSEGLEWKKLFVYDRDLKSLLHSNKYKKCLRDLKKCAGCRRTYYLCYYESRIAFPINNFLNSLLYKPSNLCP